MVFWSWLHCCEESPPPLTDMHSEYQSSISLAGSSLSSLHETRVRDRVIRNKEKSFRACFIKNRCPAAADSVSSGQHPLRDFMLRCFRKAFRLSWKCHCSIFFIFACQMNRQKMRESRTCCPSHTLRPSHCPNSLDEQLQKPHAEYTNCRWHVYTRHQMDWYIPHKHPPLLQSWRIHEVCEVSRCQERASINAFSKMSCFPPT